MLNDARASLWLYGNNIVSQEIIWEIIHDVVNGTDIFSDAV